MASRLLWLLRRKGWNGGWKGRRGFVKLHSVAVVYAVVGLVAEVVLGSGCAVVHSAVVLVCAAAVVRHFVEVYSAAGALHSAVQPHSLAEEATCDSLAAAGPHYSADAAQPVVSAALVHSVPLREAAHSAVANEALNASSAYPVAARHFEVH